MSTPRDDAVRDSSVEPNTDTRKVFRFLDLSAELRNRIYAYALSDDSRDLGYFRIPAIVRASTQTRREALPILFAENNFLCQVASDIWAPCYKRHGHPTIGFLLSRRDAGTLEFHAVVRRLLDPAGDGMVLLRNVTFKVYDTHVHSNMRVMQKSGLQRFPAAVNVHLAVVGKKVDISVEETPNHPRHRNRRHERSLIRLRGKDIDEAVNRAIQVARDVEARDGFKGFTLKDLEAVAWSVRFPD